MTTQKTQYQLLNENKQSHITEEGCLTFRSLEELDFEWICFYDTEDKEYLRKGIILNPHTLRVAKDNPKLAIDNNY